MPNSGRPGEASPAELEERSSGKPGDSPLAKPEDRKSRGNPELSRRERRRVRILRKLGDRPPVRRKERGFRETWKPEPEAMSEDAGCGETRRGVGRRDWRSEKPGKPGDLLRGTAEGWEIRGDSKNHRRHGWKMRSRGNPEPQRKTGRVDAWFRKLRVHRD